MYPYFPSVKTSAAATMLVLGGILVSGNVAAQFVEPGIDVLAAFQAENAGDGFGFVGETIGDIDGDQRPDYVIGAPSFPADGSFQGKLYVYSGTDGSVLNTIVGNPGDSIGFSVAGIGDANGDGVPDYATGGPFGNNGRLLIVSGADHAILHDVGFDAGSLFGYDINAAGDVNADGHADVVVGALAAGPAGEGVVAVVSGKDGSIVWRVPGFGPSNAFGSGVSGIGDVTGDLVPDQAVGAFAAGPAGTGLGYILSGADGSLVHTLEPLDTAGSLGWFFAHAAGDVNGDGVPDAYLGDFSDTALGAGSGRAYVFSGADGARLAVYDAEFAGDGFGIGRGAGDVNGDGRADIFLAAYLSSQGVATGGKGYLYSGRDQSLIRSMTGTTGNGQLGFDAVPVGDVNGDSYPDYLLTGVDLAFTVAGTDASPPARVASVCDLLASLPDEAYKAPAQVRKDRLCQSLERIRSHIVAGRLALAERQIRNRVLARVDGSAGGVPGNDWLVDEAAQVFVLPWVQGILTMTRSLIEDTE